MKIGKGLFLTVTVLLVAVIVAISATMLAQGPRTALVEMISHTGGTAQVNDMYDGNTTIPYFEGAAANSYQPDNFVEDNGVVRYTGGDSFVGINVSSKAGDIDWQQVKDSDVDYAMIRAAYRETVKGRIIPDANFDKNMQGAIDAGLPVGVYFYSKAVTDAEAEAEAKYVLESIRGKYSIKYPIAFYWEYDLKDDGTQDESSRTIRCNGDQVTGFIDTFCGVVKTAGFTPCYYANKSMVYNRLDLTRLSGYDMWYAEFRSPPSLYYDFKIWQYTKEGEVPGISVKVPVSLSLKNYA